MSDETDPADTPPPAGAAQPTADASRRRVLMLGAVGAASVVSIRPALASTMGSVLNCDIPIPDTSNRGKYIAADGSLVAPGTSGAYPPAYRAFKGEEVRKALSGGGSLPYTDYNRSRAYLNYVRRLQRGTGGFTCYASLQMPRT